MRNNSSDRGKSRARIILTNLAFTALIIIAFAGVSEIVFRTTHAFGTRISWFQPDPMIGYRAAPHAKYWTFNENDHPIAGRINNYGYRDREWRTQKPENTVRIALLGDSSVEAYDVELDSTFYRIAERRINAMRGRKVEFMDFARSGFTQSEELLVLKNEVLRFSPDMALLFFLPGNDIADVSKETTADWMRPFFSVAADGQLILDTGFAQTRGYRARALVSRVKRHSALISFLTERFNAYQRVRQAPAAAPSRGRTIMTGAEWAPYLTLCTAHPNPAYARSYALTKTLIEAMSDCCRQNGVRFVVVSLDIPAYLPENEKAFASIDSTFNPNFFDDDMRAFAESLDIDYLGLERAFRQAYEEKGVPLHWAHWNYAGHRLVADMLVHHLGPAIDSLERGDL